MGAPEHAIFIQSTGQSGNPLLSHYEYAAEPWRDGPFLPMLPCGQRVEEVALGKLVLSPR